MDESTTSLDLFVVKKDSADYTVASDLQEQISFDVSFKDQNGPVTSFTNPVTISLKIGSGLSNVKVYHKGVLIESNYDSGNGIVTFNSSTFSEYAAVYDVPSVVVDQEQLTLSDISGVYENSSHQLYKVTKNGDVYEKRALVQTNGFFDEYDGVYEIASLDNLKAIGTFLNNSDNDSIINPTFKIITDIDISDLGSAINTDFRGTLDGNGHTLYGTEGYTTIYGEKAVAIFSNFDKDHDCKIKDLKLDKIKVVATKEFAAILIGGNNSGDGDNFVAKVTFENITVSSTCSVLASNSKVGSLLGKGYGVKELTVNNCYSAAKLTTYGTNAGGFVGTVSNNPTKYIITNNVFAGTISAKSMISSMTGQYNRSTNIDKIDVSNNTFSGTIISTESETNQRGIFVTNPGFAFNNSNTTFSNNVVTSNGKIYINVNTDEINQEKAQSNVLDFSKIGNGIVLAEELEWSNVILKGTVSNLTVSLSNNTWNVTAISGAASYRIMLTIEGKTATVSGNTVTLTNTKGIKISKEYATVSDLAEGFGRITRVGYIIDDSATTFSHGSMQDAYAINGRMNFLRVAANGASVTAIGGSDNLNKPVKVDDEWLLIVCLDETVISPVGANFEYVIQALDGSGNVIGEYKYTDYIGSSMVPNNMSGMTFNSSSNYEESYYEYSE